MIARQRGNTTDFVYERLLEDLQQGKYLPGDKLTTDALSNGYGVSRTPVREALVRLERDGLLVSDLNTGFRVKTLTLRERCDLYELREVLEGLAVAKLTERGATAEVLAQLRQCSQGHRNASTLEERKINDHKFHTLIYDNCGSRPLRELMHNYLVLSIVFNVTTQALGGPSHVSRRQKFISHEHEAIIAAIESRNPTLARRLLSAHIAAARKEIARMIES